MQGTPCHEVIGRMEERVGGPAKRRSARKQACVTRRGDACLVRIVSVVSGVSGLWGPGSYPYSRIFAKLSERSGLHFCGFSSMRAFSAHRAYTCTFCATRNAKSSTEQEATRHPNAIARHNARRSGTTRAPLAVLCCVVLYPTHPNTGVLERRAVSPLSLSLSLPFSSSSSLRACAGPC